jgi:Uri superfamily endonuclease
MRTALDTGSYALFFEIEKPVVTRLGTFEGRYCYVGSAFGPGGLVARVSRHLRSVKPLQWHIDDLTTSPSFRPKSIFASGRRAECDLAGVLAGVFTGHPGFGSSDCRCPTHLFHVDSHEKLKKALSGTGFGELELGAFRT